VSENDVAKAHRQLTANFENGDQTGTECTEMQQLDSAVHWETSQFRDRLIGRTSAFGAEYPGSSPGPGTRILPTLNPLPSARDLQPRLAAIQQNQTSPEG
jgi:hypothetical protein